MVRITQYYQTGQQTKERQCRRQEGCTSTVMQYLTKVWLRACTRYTQAHMKISLAFMQNGGLILKPRTSCMHSKIRSFRPERFVMSFKQALPTSCSLRLGLVGFKGLLAPCQL